MSTSLYRLALVPSTAMPSRERDAILTLVEIASTRPPHLS